MSRAKLVTLLVAGLLAGLVAFAACGTDATPTPTPDEGGVGTLPAGAFTNQDIQSLTRALSSSELGAAALQSLGGQQAGIWVSGRGEVTVTPDLALLNLGVEARADTVAAARDEAAGALTAMVDVLKAAGLQDVDIQTRHFSIQPQYSSREVVRCPTGPVPAPLPGGTTSQLEQSFDVKDECFTTRESVIVGYTVSNQITAKIRDLAGAGEVIDRVAEAGGNLVRIQGISFSIEDPTELQAQALEEAVQAMVAKAQFMAEAAGVSLGNLVFMTEFGGAVPVLDTFARSGLAFAEAAVPPTPISVGELDISVTVQGVFSIAP